MVKTLNIFKPLQIIYFPLHIFRPNMKPIPAVNIDTNGKTNSNQFVISFLFLLRMLHFSLSSISCKFSILYYFILSFMCKEFTRMENKNDPRIAILDDGNQVRNINLLKNEMELIFCLVEYNNGRHFAY